MRRDGARLVGAGIAAAIAAAVALPSCGAGSRGTDCRYRPWRGTCTLYSATKVRMIERFPRSYVVLEAIYQGRTDTGQLAPEFRQQFTYDARYEQELFDHLRRYGTVRCEGQEAMGACAQPGPATAAVPPFVPGAAPDQGAVALGPQGCEKLDDLRVPTAGRRAAQTTVQLPGPFRFAENSDMTTAEHAEMAKRVAQTLRANPAIECMAIVGQISRGEPIPLAENRARAVKQLITGYGIDAKRLVTFGATVPMSGGQAQSVGAKVDPKLRSVELSVLLVRGAQQGK